GEELTWDIKTNKLSIEPILEDTSCYVNFNEKYFTLTETMLAAEEAQSDVNIDFAYTSNGCNTSTACSAGTVVNQNQVTNGLYYTSDTSKTENGEVVYYYRGAVTNNYLVFGNYCWRIVRTVEDGSVRLRYGGAATKSGNTYTCPQTGTAVNIGSSVYNLNMNSINSVNYKTSDIRTVVENWYRDNIWKNGQNIGVTNLIEDSPYCNDMSEFMLENWCIYFGFSGRMYLYGNANPQYACPSSAYAYTVAKGDLTYPVGLLTADEVAYAGAVHDAPNSSYYLYTGEDYWTMTPEEASDNYSYATVIKVSSDRLLEYSTTSPVVPVISIKSEATVEKGTGAYNDPYVIKTN
ncbi:MAG: hypothetical protein IJB82_04135, partial [Bacilli bacterium]|nr:hypothetical protein [Bacilli bacterium]